MFRDAWASTFEHVFMTRKTPRTDCPTSLPSPPGALQASPTNSPMNDLQKGLVALAGIVSGADEVDYHDITTEFEGVSKRLESLICSLCLLARACPSSLGMISGCIEIINCFVVVKILSY